MKRSFYFLATIGFYLCAFPVIATAEEQTCIPPGKWFAVKTKKEIGAQQTIQALARKRVVLLGEDHDNPEHHRWQLQLLAQLYALQPRMAIGFESFPRKTQFSLDRWVDNKLEEKAFLKEVDWEKIWAYNPDYYLPMFHFARMNGIPMVALNVERSLVSKVTSSGWKNVPESEREGLTDPAPPPKDYVEMLESVFGQHGAAPAGHGDSPGHDVVAQAKTNNKNNEKLMRFIEGQLVWDRAMAEAIAHKLEDDNTDLVVAIMGAGHIMGGYGVPHQLTELGVTNVTTALAWDGSIPCSELESGIVDVAFGIVDVKAEEARRPRLGVFLEPKDDKVQVTKVVKDSIADTTGLKAQDIVLEIAGKKVGKVSEIVDMVQRTAPGTWLPIRVDRGGRKFELIAKFPNDG
ncbi:MAG: ChaN family lipoprotein [Gammaproteobacteria bacterium]|nr:ChaN family lipoprotein [Gammaproteobacteria bacterium]MDH5692300.1 ChaN family lipoprotein [Gammaproteobacteria bacterium]